MAGSLIRENAASAKFLETILFAIFGNSKKAVESYESFLGFISLRGSKPADAKSMRKSFDSAVNLLKGMSKKE